MNQERLFINTASVCKLRQLFGSDGSNIFETASFVGLLITVLIISLQLGNSDVWNKLFLVLTICICGGLRILDFIVRRGVGGTSDPLVLLPLVGILCLAFIQTVPLPFLSLAKSVDPHQTKVFILVFGAILVAFEMLLSYTRSADRSRLLVGLVTVIGVGSSIYGVLATTIPDLQLKPASGGFTTNQGFAQFTNRNHFALLIEMTVGLLLGLLLKGEYSFRYKTAGWIAICIMLYSLLLAQSRGGLVGTIALMMFAVFFHAISKGGSAFRSINEVNKLRPKSESVLRRVIVAIGLCGILFCAMIVLIAFVGGDSVVTRFEKLPNEVKPVDQTTVNRQQIWISSLELIKERPVFGVGFGGYPVGYSRFDTSNGEIPIRQAHNEYLEIMANGGIVGFFLFSVFGMIVICRIFEQLRTGGRSGYPRRFGATIGIFGVLIHSSVDFGLHILINAMALMILIVIAIGNTDRKPSRIRK